MASVYKPTGRLKWWIGYTDSSGKWQTEPGFRDKQATEAKAKELERKAERQRAGLPVAEAERGRRPVAEPTGLYLREMERSGLGDRHRKETKRLLETLWRECKWECLAEIRSESLLAYLHKLQDAKRGPRTLNSYRDALKTFLDWCVQEHWIQENPVARVRKARAKGRKTRPRRAYTVDEFRRMLDATNHHRDIYLVAGLSGLRRNELRLLERRDLTPHGDRPTWHLRPEIVKGRRKEVIPIAPDLLPTLRRLWDGCEKATSRLFPRIPRTWTLNCDQKRAKIDHVDDEGRSVDFHSFRYFFCTVMGRLLPIQKVKVLMRHKNIRETADLYTDLGLEDVAEDIWSLPTVLPPEGNNAQSRRQSRRGKTGEEE